MRMMTIRPDRSEYPTAELTPKPTPAPIPSAPNIQVEHETWRPSMSAQLASMFAPTLDSIELQRDVPITKVQLHEQDDDCCDLLMCAYACDLDALELLLPRFADAVRSGGHVIARVAPDLVASDSCTQIRRLARRHGFSNARVMNPGAWQCLRRLLPGGEIDFATCVQLGPRLSPVRDAG